MAERRQRPARADSCAHYIKVSGAIDMPTVRKAITNVMEAGEKAFRLGKEKYGF